MTQAYTPPANGFRTFIIVWITQSISVLGSALTHFALSIWLVQVLYPLAEQRPQLSLALSATALAFALPTVFLAPLAGAWADRHDRKRTMIVVDALSGVLSLLIGYLVFTNQLELWSLITLDACAAILGTFHGSAFDTSYAMLVPEKNLPRANGMMQTLWSLSGIISPSIAAGIIALPALARSNNWQGFLAGLPDGTSLTMFIDAITFFMAAGTLLFLFIPSPVRTDLAKDGKPQKSIWADIKEGAVYILKRRPLLWLLGTFALVNFAAAPTGVFMPMLVKFNLAEDWAARGFTLETALALIATMSSIGGVIGGVFISVWGGLKRRRVYGVVGALLIQAVFAFTLGLSNAFLLTGATILLSNMMIPIANAHSQAIWQTQTPRELQGRVFSVRRVIAQFTWPLSTAVAGVAGGLLNPGVVIAGLAVIVFVFCFFQSFNPYLMQVEDKEYLEKLAASA